MRSDILALVCVVLCTHGCINAQNPIVHVEEGAVRGTYMQSANGRTYAAFRGIPYARPPVGKYRFKEPTPVKRWPGVWPAAEYGSHCLQYDYTGRVSGSEDCLFLNIFSPKLPVTGIPPMLDVLVYIHGGAFMFGSSTDHRPDLLLDHDIVVVTLNYRLGILGFLSTEDDVVPGNNGLKDQALALRWIQRNIAAFGGNPAKVTLMGTSAGGASVHYHYLSPQSQGLFQRGISLSGTALSPWAQGRDHRAKANKLAELLGCSIYSSRDLVDCLRYRPAFEIVQQTKHFLAWRYNPCNPFAPTVEKAGSTPFISKEPVDVILEGAAQNLPWITSVTSEEGIFPAADFATNASLMEELDLNFNKIAPHIMFYNHTVSSIRHDTVGNLIKQFYFPSKPIRWETVNELIQMFGDRIFVVDIERTARLMASSNIAPVYFYKFAYRGSSSYSNFISGTNINMGVSHGDDETYIFKTHYVNTDTTDEDSAVSKLMIHICINFMKNGNPTPSEYNVEWLPLAANDRNIAFLHIMNSSTLKMEYSEDLGNRKFWDSLPIEESQITAYKLKKYSDEL